MRQGATLEGCWLVLAAHCIKLAASGHFVCSWRSVKVCYYLDGIILVHSMEFVASNLTVSRPLDQKKKMSQSLKTVQRPLIRNLDARGIRVHQIGRSLRRKSRRDR